MPFEIPNEDFHGGFGLPHEDEGEDEYEVEESEEAAQEAYDNLARELVMADNAILSLEQDKKCLIHYLKETTEWLNYFITTNPDNIHIEEARTALWAAECRLMEMEESL